MQVKERRERRKMEMKESEGDKQSGMFAPPCCNAKQDGRRYRQRCGEDGEKSKHLVNECELSMFTLVYARSHWFGCGDWPR